MATGAPRDPRVTLAADRTLLAWIRTALGLIGFGFLVARSRLLFGGLADGSEGQDAYSALGVALILLGTVVSVAAGVWHRRFVRRYEDEGVGLEPVTLATFVLSVVLGVAGLGLAWLVLFR
jgi:putative membrane protein